MWVTYAANSYRTLIDINALHVQARTQREVGPGFLLLPPVLLGLLLPGYRLPGPVLVENDLVLILREVLGAHDVQEISVQVEIHVEAGLIADWTLPGGFPLVHLDEEVGVKTLEVVTGGGTAGGRHPHLPQGTGQGHLDVGGGDVVAIIHQLLLDHLPGELLLPAALVLQPGEQLVAGELLHQVDGEDPVLPVVGRPLDADRVGQGGVQLAEG